MDETGTGSASLCARFLASVEDCAMVILDPEGRVLTWGRGAQLLQGYEPAQIIGRSFCAFFPTEDADAGTPQRHLAEAAARGHVTYEGWRVRADGSKFWADGAVTAIYDEQHQLLGFGDVARDITNSRRFQKELMRRALHDPLTGLANRVLLHDRLGSALARLQRNPGTIAVFFVDLDGFKSLNDSLGHSAGDLVLRTVAERMRATLRAQDTVARVGGDEFVLLCEGLGAEMSAGRIAERLESALAPPVGGLGDAPLEIKASIGVALTDTPEVDAGALIEAADVAMYHAKREPGARIRVRFHDGSMRTPPGRFVDREPSLQPVPPHDQL